MGLSALIVQSADQGEAFHDAPPAFALNCPCAPLSTDAATKAALAEKNTVTEQIAASGKRVQKALKALRDAASGKGNSDGDEEDAGPSADAAPAAPAEATAAAAIDEFPEQVRTELLRAGMARGF